uniref:ATP synthase complex subunit 8 n=1 Tax=Stomatella planulata TaxID=529752 RepID=A0A1I9SSW3_9VEST|nr:ATP synthase F0 subunit 8 [Stomatella planulata]AOZ71833.1 ATP synthase subunit 8 [Stomatella planulata]
MPQLAPVNWLLLFILFWLVIILVSTLIWWTYTTKYSISSTNSISSHSLGPNSWRW